MKLRVRLRAKVNERSAEVVLHPKFSKGKRVSVDRVTSMLAGGRSRMINIIAAIEWDDGGTEVVSNTMRHRTLAYLGTRVAILVAEEISK